jgi:hypothetical protein
VRYTLVGGEIVGDLEIEWSGSPPVEHDEMMGQVARAKILDLPQVSSRIDFVPDNGRKLAVVGGGRSIIEHEQTLKNWSGDIWTINGTYHWCAVRGIDSTLIACDPHVIVAQWAKGVKKALVTTRCHPDVFKVLRENGAEVRTFDLEGDNRVMSGSSTACASIHLGIIDGYKSITYFGCESSYPPGGTHAYMHEPRKQELIVEVGGEHFHTAPDYLIQALEMANIFRMTGSDGGLKEESGGLLRALIADYAYRIIWVSKPLMDGLSKKTTQEAA